MSVIEYSGPMCNCCGVLYVPGGEGRMCQEPHCSGCVTWEATCDALAAQLRGAVDDVTRLECALAQVRSRINEGDYRGALSTIRAALGPEGGQ